MRSSTRYLRSSAAETGVWQRPESDQLLPKAYFQEIAAVNEAGVQIASVASEAPFQLRLRVRVVEDVGDIQIALRFTNGEGIPVFTTASSDSQRRLHGLSLGNHTFSVEIPGNLLTPGRYSITAAVTQPNRELFDAVVDGLAVNIEDMGSHAGILRDGRLGLVSPLMRWTTVPEIDGR